MSPNIPAGSDVPLKEGTSMNILGTIGLALAIGLLALGCQVQSPATAPLAATPTPVLPPILSEQEIAARAVTAATAPISSGQQLFQNKGCATCHGQNAEGTDIAPALTGHSATQVKRQVRAPLGIMPVFPPDKISNEELEAISEFIEGLGGGHAHVRGPGSPDEVAIHHWMALFSTDAEDPSEAIHHLGHIIELTEGQHRSTNVGVSAPQSLDKFRDSLAYLEEFGVTYPNGLDADGRITVDYGVIGIPVTFFINREGMVERRWVGAVRESQLVIWIEELEAGVAPTGDAEAENLKDFRTLQ